MNYLRTNLSRFKLITFDVTDTLLEYAVRPERHYAQVINGVLGPHINLQIDEDAISKSFVSCFRMMKSQYPNFGCTGKHPDELNNHEENWRWWWRTLVERVTLEAASQSGYINVPPVLLTTIANQLIDDYTYDTKHMCWKKRPGVDQFMSAAQETANSSTSQNQRRMMGVISNFDSRLSTILRNHGISSASKDNPRLDFTLTSYEAGVEKPDPQIFHIALNRANQISHASNVHPHEALHIGNLCKEDYLGARSAGWHALLVNVSSTKKNEELRTVIPKWHIFAGFPELQTRLETDPSFEW